MGVRQLLEPSGKGRAKAVVTRGPLAVQSTLAQLAIWGWIVGKRRRIEPNRNQKPASPFGLWS